MAMQPLSPLAMSQTKEDLRRHLNMSPAIYEKCSKEADRVYRSLTSERRHLKKNCKRKPPYDWSDIVERSKDEAMKAIASHGDADTTYFWNLAQPTEECPNWIARWFLYHKFRYRDGRNRNHQREEHGRHHGSSSNPNPQATEYWETTSNVTQDPYHSSEAMSSASFDGHQYGGGSAVATSSTPNYLYQASYQASYSPSYQTSYQMNQSRPVTNTSYTTNNEDGGQAKPFYDPIRDRRVS